MELYSHQSEKRQETSLCRLILLALAPASRGTVDTSLEANQELV